MDTFRTKKARGLGTTLAGLAASVALLEPVKAGLMRVENSSPEARQVHRDMGLELKHSVVSLFIDGVNEGSGVLIGDGSCVILTWHQLRDAEVDETLNKLVEIRVGANYFNPEETVNVVRFIKHPNVPGTGELGTDIIIAKLSKIPKDAQPLEVATESLAVGDVVKLGGFGTPANRYGLLPVTGELLAGQAPVEALPSSGGGYISTRFKISNSLPLLFGGTEYISGGFLGKTVTRPDGIGTKNVLIGTVVGGTPPGTNELTFSINLFNYKTWISDTLEILTPRLPPKLSCQALNNQEIKIICEGSSLQQGSGKWILQKTTNLTDWNDMNEETQSLLSQYGSIVVSTLDHKAFYRLRWEAND